MSLFIKMWHVIGFLGIVLLALILVAIIVAVIDTIYSNIKQAIMRNKSIKETQEEINELIKMAIVDDIKNQIKEIELSKENEK